MKWAKCDNRTAATAPARKAAEDRFITLARKQFGDLPDDELAFRASHLRQAHYTRMAMRSAEVRRARRASAPTAPAATE